MSASQVPTGDDNAARRQSASASVRSTMEHIDRLVAKRAMLVQRERDALEQLAAALSRDEINAHPMTKVALVDWARDWGIPHAQRIVAEALGETLNRIYSYRTQPVTEVGERVTGTFPIEWQITPRKGVPTVYLLMSDDDRIVYVGFSTDVRNRLRCHWRDRDKRPYLSRWVVLSCQSIEEAYELEGTLIFQHQPSLNKADMRERRRPR